MTAIKKHVDGIPLSTASSHDICCLQLFKLFRPSFLIDLLTNCVGVVEVIATIMAGWHNEISEVRTFLVLGINI